MISSFCCSIETKNHKKIEPVHEKHTILLQKIDELSFTESLSFEEWKIKKDQTLKDFFEISLQIASSSYKDLFQVKNLLCIFIQDLINERVHD